tara:strand:+ start:477 stop:692 length:216 start_codon:yes stop_codon:yes gene_type:complete
VLLFLPATNKAFCLDPNSKQINLSDLTLKNFNKKTKKRTSWISMADVLEHEVLVCDNGTGFVKCGFAGEVR